jgi:hypothetical protein
MIMMSSRAVPDTFASKHVHIQGRGAIVHHQTTKHPPQSVRQDTEPGYPNGNIPTRYEARTSFLPVPGVSSRTKL